MLFCSEVQHSRSVSLEDAIKIIKKNNNVALKGAIKEAETTSGNPDRDDINRALKKSLDLFASVSNIKVSVHFNTPLGFSFNFDCYSSSTVVNG